MDTPLFYNGEILLSFDFSTPRYILPGDIITANLDVNNLTFRRPRKQSKCFSARRGLKKFGESSFLKQMADKFYNGCLHCAWYSYNFPSYIKDDDFEKLKVQFVRHMNRSHPDICKKKLMKKLNNRENMI